MLKIPLIIKSLTRDWRSGELTLLFLALVIAMACISALNIFAGRVNEQLARQASQLLGADLVVRSSIPIDNVWIKKAQSLGLKQTTTLSFFSMVEHDGKLQLAQIKAVKAPFPLLGELRIAKQPHTSADKIFEVPKEGTVWVAPRILPLLTLNVGESLMIGAAPLAVTGILVEEPGQTGDWFNISPRIMMNWQDVINTKVIQTGSNVTYRWLLTGPKDKLTQLKIYLNNKLTEQQELTDSTSTNPSITQIIQRTLNYFNLGTLMCLVLAGVAISMASLRYSMRHRQQVAILRCFGASQYQILKVYLGSILLLGILACLIGISIGYIVQPLLMEWLRGLLPQFEPQLPLKPALFSMAIGLIVLLCFSSINILKLRHISAANILRREQLSWTFSTWAGYGFAFLLLGSLAYFYTGSWRLTLSVLLGCLFFIGLVVSSIWLIFNYLSKAKNYMHISWRFGFANIARNLSNSSLQVIGIGLALTAILSLYILRNDLLGSWQQQADSRTNFFIINIEPNQVSAIDKFLTENNIQVSTFYPMVKGRLIAINNTPVQQIFGERAKQITVLRRELNLSWTNELPPENKIMTGLWHPATQDKWVSVEKGVVEKLGLALGDKITFRVGDSIITVTVTSVRSVDWATFNPNFFTLFKPGVLNDLPQTYMASMLLTEAQQNKLNAIVSQFPNVTIIDIANILNKINAIFENTAKAINFMSFFGFFAGLIIVILAMLSLMGIKQQETYVLKILGMGKRQLLWIQSSESLIIGFYAGLLAIITAIIINNYLAKVVLGIDFNIPWKLILIVPIATAILTVLVNTLVLRSQYQKKGLTRLSDANSY
ncbi:ABC transporter permease [Legionella brunensis]|uniref:FtsX-like permease family protein n=1 Tax=Legionella brunensis TaxID=29422 RepID=A0A0W0S4I5_9GAMM|nr:FtsX-like permease family protein [Legionella brunensis]KTC78406.1 FtsX-like permease family protein [Legionella brunensis]